MWSCKPVVSWWPGLAGEVVAWLAGGLAAPAWPAAEPYCPCFTSENAYPWQQLADGTAHELVAWLSLLGQPLNLITPVPSKRMHGLISNALLADHIDWPPHFAAANGERPRQICSSVSVFTAVIAETEISLSSLTT